MTQDELLALVYRTPERLHAVWVPLADTGIEVTARPVSLGPDGPFPPVNARTAQAMADALGGYCTCAEIDDLIWTHADIRLEPHLYPNDGSWRQAMQWDTWAQAELSQRRIGPETLVSLGDKTWLLRDAAVAGKVPNYGLHVATKDCNMAGRWKGMQTYPTASRTAARVVQTIAYAHNAVHADYSQHCRLWRWAGGVEQAIPWMPVARRLAGC